MGRRSQERRFAEWVIAAGLGLMFGALLAAVVLTRPPGDAVIGDETEALDAIAAAEMRAPLEPVAADPPTPSGSAPVESAEAHVRGAAPARSPAISSPPVELARRELRIPVQGVEPEALVPSFDDPRGGGRRHEAIDILAPRGTAVLAVESGRIARLFVSDAGGLTVYQFDPDEAYVYYYAHLARYATGLADGDEVVAGQVLGYVGTTGNAPKDVPHLHFAIMRLTPARRWWDGTAVDPYPLLRGPAGDAPGAPAGQPPDVRSIGL